MFQFLFKYPQSVFQDSDFILANTWPMWLMYLAGIAFALALVAMLSYRRNKTKHLNWLKLSVIGVLQMMMFALVLFVLWQPALVTERLMKGENSVAVLLDTSASMAISDGDSTRMAQAQELLTPDALKDISSQYTVLPFGFSDQARPMDSFSDLPAPGETSNIGASLLQTLRQSGSASLGAIILISDGADNSGNITQAQLSEIASYGVPIHTVGIGRTKIPEDLELQQVVLPEKALPGTTLTARLSIRHDQGGTARVKVYNGDTFLSTEEVPLDPNDSVTTAYIDVEVPDPGQMDLRFTLDPLTNETNLVNNSRSQVVDVPESRYKILYVEGEPRWEYKFMQRALDDDPSIQLTTLLRVSTNKFYRQGIDNPDQLADGFPTKRAELFEYDALIIGSVEAAEFTDEQQQMIRDFVSDRGGSLMMLGGLNGLGKGGWSESVVNQILPSRLNPDHADFKRDKVPVVLTDSGKAAPMLRFSEDEADNLKQWSELPEIADYQDIGPLRPAATTLLNIQVNGREQPLLVFQPYGKGQTYILATGGTWRWQMSLPHEDMHHETFWRQLARGLVANSPRPFELSTVTEDDKIKVRAQVRDPDAEENQGLSVTAVVSADNNESMSLNLLPVAGKPGSFEAEFSPPAPGLYNIEAISLVGDEPVNSTRTATRYDRGMESYGIRQNQALLKRLSDATGGQYWTPDEWDDIPEAISYSTAGITSQDIRYLWDAPFFFFMLIFLKGLEWALRRVWRTI